MEASDHHRDSTEKNQNVEENQSVEENQNVVTEPSASSSLPANNNSEEYSDPMGNNSDVLAKGLSTEEYSDPMGNNSDVLAKGLSSMLSTIIRDFDCRAQETIESQDQLCFALDRLTGELDQLLEDAPLPFIMQHAAKICSVRTRVTSLNSLLKSIQGRIDRIDRMMTVGNAHETTTNEGSG